MSTKIHMKISGNTLQTAKARRILYTKQRECSYSQAALEAILNTEIEVWDLEDNLPTNIYMKIQVDTTFLTVKVGKISLTTQMERSGK